MILPTASKIWHLKYRFEGKSKLLSLGPYPFIPLVEARRRRDEAKKYLAHGIDPAAVKKAQRQVSTEEDDTFELVAREWYAKFSHNWADTHLVKTKSIIERNLFPWLGQRPISKIKAPELLEVLRRVESRGALETAHRLRGLVGQIFRYAIATGRAEHDLSADLKGALPPTKEKHLASITVPKMVGSLLRAIDGYEGHFVTKCALKLAPLVFVRPGELRQAEWSEIDFEDATWNIPAEKMKMGEPHLVPLAKQTVAILRELHPLTGNGRFVFPSLRTDKRPMSNNAVLSALRRMGYAKEEMSGHGFRAMARTILDEVLHVRPDYIEHQLAHAVRDPLGRAYNRTAHLEERRKMMQLWADYLDKLKA